MKYQVRNLTTCTLTFCTYYLNSPFLEKDTTKSDEIIDVENEEKAKELKSEPQVLKHVL